MIQTAHTTGLAKDQLENFLKCQYVPLPWQMEFHAQARKCDKEDGPTKLGAGGARGPGKSKAVFGQLTLDDCQRVPGLKGLFLRQTGRAAQESFTDLINESLTGKIAHKENKGLLRFPNKSRILLGGFKDERDIDNYVGIQYDVMAVEEINQLSQRKVDMLLGSLRTSKPNWRPRLYASFNPGGLGHKFIKETFVLPYRQKKETDTRFIPATYKDNPFLNKEYIDYLEGLEGVLGKAWRDGDFDIFEGQFFTEWNYDKHTCQPFTIPASWKRYRTIDFGRAAPFVCYWVAIDYDGNAWVYREYQSHRPDLHEEGKDADENALKVVELSENDPRIEGKQYQYSVADSSIFSEEGHGETIAKLMARVTKAKYGEQKQLLCLPSSKKRIARWVIMHEYLHWDKEHEPKLKFFNTCFNAIRTIPTLLNDPKQPEDVDTTQEDHPADAISYLLQTLRERKSTKPLNATQKKLAELKLSMGLTGGYNPGFYE